MALNPYDEAFERLDEQEFYDYEAARRAGARPDASGHWPSEFKLPGHPNEVVGGFNTRTGKRVPGTARAGEKELIALGWDPASAAMLANSPEQGQSPVNPYLETLDSLGSARTRALRRATIAAEPQTPDRAATVRKLSIATGLAPEVVERNFDDLSTRVKVEQTPYDQMQRETPALSEWAADPNNAAVAKDDLEQLGFLEWIVTAPQRAYARSVHEMRVSALRTQQLYRELTQEERDSLASEKYASTVGGELGARESWFRRRVTGGAELLANSLQGGWSAAKRAALGAGVGGTIGFVFGGGAGTVPGAKFGARVGAVIGAAEFGFELEAGIALDEFLESDVLDEHGQPLDGDTARAAALAAGAVNAGLEVVGLGVLAKSIPGIDRLKGALTRGAIRQALKNPTIRAALADTVRSYTGTLTKETGVEVAQRAVTILAGELAKATSGQQLTSRTPQDILEDLAEEASGALGGFAFLALPGPTMRLAHGVQQARRAEQSEAWFTALGEGVAQSETIKLLPEAAQELLARATADGPVEHLYAPADTFREYWQTQGLDPAEVAAELTGDPEALSRATETGTDLKIPTAAYAVKLAGTEHHAFFAQELRLAPEEMNLREGRAFQVEMTAQLEAQRSQQADQPAAAAVSPIRQALTAELTAAGVEEQTAQNYATLVDSAFRTMAENAGVDPQALYERYGLRVQRPDLGYVPPALPPPVARRAPVQGQAAAQPDLANLLGEHGYVGPERRETVGEAPGGVERRAPTAPLDRDATIDLTDVGSAAARMFAEDPQVARKAEAMRARAAASRIPAPPRVPVDTGTEEAETTAEPTDADTTTRAAAARGERLPDAAAEPAAAPPGGQESVGGEGARPTAGATGRLPRSTRDRFAALLADARAAGFAGTDDDLAAAFLFHYRNAQAVADDLHDLAVDQGWRGLLVEISKYGGIGIDADPVFAGEISDLMDGLAKGDSIIKKSGRNRFARQGQRVVLAGSGIEGAPGVFKGPGRGGLSLDHMRENLAQDPRWAHMEDINDLLVALEDAVQRGRLENRGETMPGEATPDTWSVLERLYDVREGIQWWLSGEERPDLIALRARLEAEDLAAAGGADVELLQTLFDDLLEPPAPTVDVLETGEQQPRLPGAEGVRDTEVATPAIEAPFSLTSEIDEGEAETQTELFASGRRGSLKFGADRQMTITLLENADLSTFLHEGGHFFLEVFSDLVDQVAMADPATLTPQQQQLQTDYRALLDWLGVADRSQLTVAQHEQFARAFEAYLMEGRAPSLELRSVFAKFRAWLVGIYRTLTNLDVQLSDPVRAVFDRLIASDRAIAEAEAAGRVEPMFTTPESAGTTPEDFELYRGTVARASRTAREQLDRKLLAEVQREQKQAWQDQRSAIEAEVATEVYAMPVYQALAAMQRGTHPDGTPLVEAPLESEPFKLARAILVERYGKERLKNLPRPYIYAAEGGLDPDLVAERFGFDSGDDLLSAVEIAPPMRAYIDRETARRMIEQHGSLLLDGARLDAEAKAALSNEDRETVIRAELRALAGLRRTVDPFVKAERAKGREAVRAERGKTEAAEAETARLKARARSSAVILRAAIPPDAQIRELARSRLARTAIRDLQPELFWHAARRAGQRAIELHGRQDIDAAITAKQQELVNLAMYREGVRALEDIEARVREAKNLAKPAARARLGKAGEAYLDQVDGILDRYQFASVSRKALDRRASLRKFVAALEGEGLPVDLPEELLEETRRVHYRELSYEALVGVSDGLRQILHLARLKNRLLKNKAARDLDAVTMPLAESIRENTPATKKQVEFDAKAERRHRVSALYAALVKVSVLAKALDGYKDRGPMHEAFIRPLNAAADWEATRKETEGARYWTVIKQHYTPTEIARWSQKLHIPAIGTSLSKRGRLSVALNWGSDTNRERLLSDPARRWTAYQVQAILNTLDKRDWDFVQATWDYNQGFQAEIGALETRMKGVAPEWVAPLPVDTPFGQYRGGYYHITYDRRLARGAAQLEALDALEKMRADAYVSSTTRHGHVKTRQAHTGLPLRLDLDGQFSHIDQVIHDLAYRETLFDLSRILRSKEVSSAIYETFGDATYDQLTDVLKAAAGGLTEAANVWEKGATWMRTGGQVAALGLNFWTMLQQPLGLFNTMAQIGIKQHGPRWVIKGAGHWMQDAAHMQNTAAWIMEVSPFMRGRAGNANQDLSDVRAALLVPGGWFDAQVQELTGGRVSLRQMVNWYMYGIVQAQRIADIPTWLAGYEKARAEGTTERDAYAAGDQLVREAQGSAQIHDLARVQRGGPVARLFMMFYSYANTVLGTTATIAGRTNLRRPTDVAAAVVDLGLLYAMPATFTIALLHAFGREDDDDENLLLAIMRESVAMALNTVVGVRELSGIIREGNRGYSGPAGTRLIQSMYQLSGQIAQGEMDDALWRAVNSTAGIIFRYPAVQVQKTVDGLAALAEGRTENPGAVVVGPAPKR